MWYVIEENRCEKLGSNRGTEHYFCTANYIEVWHIHLGTMGIYVYAALASL